MGRETLLSQERPKRYLGHHYCCSCRPPHIPRLHKAVPPRARHALGALPVGDSVSDLPQLPPPHSKFSAALTYWLAGEGHVTGRRNSQPRRKESPPHPLEVSRDAFHSRWSLILAWTFLLRVAGFLGADGSKTFKVGYFRWIRAFHFFSLTASRLHSLRSRAPSCEKQSASIYTEVALKEIKNLS